jgi:hypothetical protein
MRGALQEFRRRRTLVPADLLEFAIRKSSNFDPERSAATNQRGCLPRPDQVSVGADGLKYFGRTFGYLRRGRSAFDFGGKLPASPIGLMLFSCARRFSNSIFSAAIFSARTFVSSSYRSQSLSKSIASKSDFLSIVPSPEQISGAATGVKRPACSEWMQLSAEELKNINMTNIFVCTIFKFAVYLNGEGVLRGRCFRGVWR